MSKVFRFHEGKDIEDWQRTSPYGDLEIKAMKDPSGDSSKRVITSIPSPFARIDLFKTAFKLVTLTGELDGNKSHHKLVSDALDMAEIAFNADRFGTRLDIVPWNIQYDLDQLTKAHIKKQSILGETLKLYLTQDSPTYNFSQVKNLYVFVLDHEVVGGTSPATLFFSTSE